MSAMSRIAVSQTPDSLRVATNDGFVRSPDLVADGTERPVFE